MKFNYILDATEVNLEEDTLTFESGVFLVHVFDIPPSIIYKKMLLEMSDEINSGDPDLSAADDFKAEVFKSSAFLLKILVDYYDVDIWPPSDTEPFWNFTFYEEDDESEIEIHFDNKNAKHLLDQLKESEM